MHARSPLALLVLVFALALVLGPSPAFAQGSAALSGARAALTSYDLSAGSASLRALGELAPIATGGSGEAAEAHGMRALAGAEMWAAATMLADDAARARVASALGVTVDDADAHLRTELSAVAHGDYRIACREARQLLDLASTVHGDGSHIERASGARRDAALALFVRAHPDPSVLSSLHVEVTDPGVAGWDQASRHELGALREALAAAERARRAASAGDPLLAVLGDALAAVPAVVTSVVLRPRVDVEAMVGLPAIDFGQVIELDGLVLVGEREIHVGRAPIVTVDATGALVHAVPGDVLPALRTVPLPADLPAVPQSLDGVVAAASALGLNPGTTVVVAPMGVVPVHIMTRVLLSLARASVTVTCLGAEHSDGRLIAIPFHIVRTADAAVPDVRVRVRLGGYAVARGERGRDTTLPRVRDAGGHLIFDQAGLIAFLESGAHATLSLEAMATVDASEVVRTAFLAAEHGATVTWLLP